MSKPPISIVGAGIGGLALGRCLLKRGIQATLYQQGPQTSRYGYGITLHAPTYRPLLKILDMDESTFRKRVAVDGAVGGTGVINPRKLVLPGLVGESSFRAHRAKLEHLLGEGLDIRRDAAVEAIETEATGSLLRLHTGEMIDESIVIGADGVHSVIRKSLLPDTELTILPHVALNGKRWISTAVYLESYASEMRESSVVEQRRENGVVLQISINDFSEDKVSISWVYSRPSRGDGDALYKPNRPLAKATDIPAEFFSEFAALEDHLIQPFKDVFDAQKLKSERVLSWLMRTVEPALPQLEELAREDVFLIGDAAHAQPILGGEGANAAIADALDLAERIASEEDELLTAWYSSRYADWQAGVEKSKKNIKEMHALPKAVL